MKKCVLRNFTKFTGKHLCQILFFNKVADRRPATLLKKRLWHRFFPLNSMKFLSTPFLQNTSERPLLRIIWFRIRVWFRPVDYCFNQLIVISHEIYKLFDDGLEVRGIFLDISKAFDKVWHGGLLFKLNRNGILEFSKLFCNCLCFRKQRVILKRLHSSWDRACVISYIYKRFIS